MRFVAQLLSSDFLPHGTCYLWNPQDRVAARHLGWSYHPLLLLHPACPDLSVAAPQRSSVQLDFLDVRNVHFGVRHHPSDGDMDDLASHIFPVRGGEGNYGACALISMKP